LVNFSTMVSNDRSNVRINDLVFSSEPHYVSRLTSGPPLGGSVHLSLRFDLYFANIANHEKKQLVNPSPLSYLKGNYTAINKVLSEYCWDDLIATDDLDTAYTTFCDVVLKVVNAHCPRRRKIVTKLKYVPHGMKSRYRKKHKMFKRIANARDRQEYKKFSKECENIVKNFYDNTEIRAVESKDSFFRFLKKHFRPKSGITTVITNDGHTADRKLIVELFADHFGSVFCEPTEEQPSNSDDYLRNEDDALVDFKIDDQLVLRELLRLPLKETNTPDGIPPVVYNKCAAALLVPIVHILKLSLKHGRIPRKWRHIIVQPVYKKGCKRTISNYRPIGLTCILSKICERIVRDQLMSYLKLNNMMTDRQHGFRSGRSTITSHLQSQSEWKNLLLQNKEFYMILLDFSKAFDVVDHTVLRRKLKNAGIQGQAFNWISSYLSHRTMSVMLDGVTSSTRPVHSGVIQGSAIGPALFSFFAADIPKEVGDLAATNMFADDVKLYALEKLNLEKATSKVVDWSLTNKLPLAPAKSVLIKIRRRRTPRTVETIKVGDTHITSTTHVGDLGVTIADDLECAEHIRNILSKAFKISNLLLRTLKSKKLELFRKGFLTMVRPIVEYCSVVWSPTYAKDINALESLQRRFTKKAQRKCRIRNEDYSSRLVRWNLKTLESRRIQLDLTAVYKLIHGYMDLNCDLLFTLVWSDNDFKLYPKYIPSQHRNLTQVNTLAFRTYKIWNALPYEMRFSPSIGAFKYKLRKYDLNGKFISKIAM
jgi:ribonucleases P/MRP protein subunit RPP40